VQIVDFSPRMPEVLRSVIAELKTAGLQGLILDLRENPGGQLQALIDGANLFLDKGPLAVIKDSGGHERLVATTGQSFLGGFPLALLIDETTGSSAEAFALAMQERGRAVLVGSRTYGKGSLQMILPLEGAAGAVKLTARPIDRQGDACERLGGRSERRLFRTDGAGTTRRLAGTPSGTRHSGQRLGIRPRRSF
jgi:carboxyl-terminal processing protease